MSTVASCDGTSSAKAFSSLRCMLIRLATGTFTPMRRATRACAQRSSLAYRRQGYISCPARTGRSHLRAPLHVRLVASNVPLPLSPAATARVASAKRHPSTYETRARRCRLRTRQDQTLSLAPRALVRLTRCHHRAARRGRYGYGVQHVRQRRTVARLEAGVEESRRRGNRISLKALKALEPCQGSEYSPGLERHPSILGSL